jgi:hypothetical protein
VKPPPSPMRRHYSIEVLTAAIGCGLLLPGSASRPRRQINASSEADWLPELALGSTAESDGSRERQSLSGGIAGGGWAYARRASRRHRRRPRPRGPRDDTERGGSKTPRGRSEPRRSLRVPTKQPVTLAKNQSAPVLSSTARQRRERSRCGPATLRESFAACLITNGSGRTRRRHRRQQRL